MKRLISTSRGSQTEQAGSGPTDVVDLALGAENSERHAELQREGRRHAGGARKGTRCDLGPKWAFIFFVIFDLFSICAFSVFRLLFFCFLVAVVCYYVFKEIFKLYKQARCKVQASWRPPKGCS